MYAGKGKNCDDDSIGYHFYDLFDSKDCVFYWRKSQRVTLKRDINSFEYFGILIVYLSVIC